MRVILLKDVSGQGKKGDVKNVSNGFAANFLFPKFLARPATESAISELQGQKNKIISQQNKKNNEAEKIIGAISGKSINILSKASIKGTLFKGISAEDIVKEARKQLKACLPVQSIKISEHLKSTGIFTIAVELNGFNTNLTVIIKAHE